MSRGNLIFSHNNRSIDYGKIALANACSKVTIAVANVTVAVAVASTNHNQQGTAVAVVNDCCCWLVIIPLFIVCSSVN